MPGLERWFAASGWADTGADRCHGRGADPCGDASALQQGGGAAVDAVTGYLRWASGLLRSRCSDDTGQELRVGLADLYSVAGMSLHDSGRHLEGAADRLRHLATAANAWLRHRPAIDLAALLAA
jgi:hypothetical protein